MSLLFPCHQRSTVQSGNCTDIYKTTLCFTAMVPVLESSVTHPSLLICILFSQFAEIVRNKFHPCLSWLPYECKNFEFSIVPIWS